jgi:Tol biopolymer transport system component
MAITKGSTLGSYEISGSLGAGGMGEVWQAVDTRLGRDVALKVLPDDFDADPDRHARFEREAKVLASLNHPNIATLYGLDHLDGKHALVMELVEGVGLDQRIENGPIGVDEAVDVALQITEALEAAHEARIVHRDLKPANVMIRPDGTVKVLDFGLAKAWENKNDDSGLSRSPTMTRNATAAGVILGTAAYMSPEQARGQQVDRRADIWAFGVVLWEMLTGRKLFAGETVSDVLASVLKEVPDLDLLPATLPPPLRRLVARCLDRDPRKRLQAIGEARVVLEYLRSGERVVGEAEQHAGESAAPKRFGWMAIAAVSALIAAASVVWVWRQPAASESVVVRAQIAPPEGTFFELDPASPGAVAVSPDGRRMVFTARDSEGHTFLWVRSLRSLEARKLPGTGGTAYPFWSPDSRSVGFFSRAEGKLRRISADGGPPLTICEAPNGKGGSWSVDGRILFTRAHNTPIMMVDAAGGEPVQVTEIGEGESGHRFPLWLSGDRFLYLARSRTSIEGDRVMIADLADDSREVLLAAASNVALAADHLLFVRGENLMAQPFDERTGSLQGDARPVAEGVLYIGGARLGAFSTSRAGVLVYNSGSLDRSSELVWVDRRGQLVEVLGEGVSHRDVQISPTGDVAAVEVIDNQAGTSDLWLYDLERRLRTRFTFDPSMDWFPAFSPDGQEIVFSSARTGSTSLWLKDLGGSGNERLLLENPNADMAAEAWSPDGKWVVFSELVASGRDIFAIPADGGEPVDIVASSFQEWHAAISPDGRWIAYTTDESGRAEVYVTTFPEPGRKWQISMNGGLSPRWRGDGGELFYQSPTNSLVAVEVADRGGSLVIGASETLFSWQRPSGPGRQFDVSKDGETFLLNRSINSGQSFPLTLVLNWEAELDRP